MFSMFGQKIRKSTFFEKLLLVVGVAVGVVGYRLINAVYGSSPELTWLSLSAIFLWMILIFIVILTDSSEGIKEELAIIIREHVEETKLLREEVKLLREDLKVHVQKRK
jgi:surface polysaccharide O-acyltransferase-like enzyme